MRAFPFRAEAARRSFMLHYEQRERRWPVPFETKKIDTFLGRTFVRISGPVGAPALVLLHGAGGSSLSWTENAQTLSAHFRLFAIDCIYDFGRSECIRYPTEANELLRWLDEVLNGLGLTGDLRLMGHSYGGWISARYALYRPERLSRVVVLGPAATVLPIAREWYLRWLLTMLPLRCLTTSFYQWLFDDMTARGDEGKRAIQDRIENSLLAKQCFVPRRLIAPDVLRDEEWRSLSVPMLLLVGEKEKIYSAYRAVERLREVAPQIEAEIVMGAGHGLTVSQAEAVNQRLLRFLG